MIDRILSFDPEIRDLHALIPILPDPTKKGQGPKMAGLDARKKKDEKSSKEVEALKYLMGRRPIKGIGGSSEPRKDKEKENGKCVAALLET